VKTPFSSESAYMQRSLKPAVIASLIPSVHTALSQVLRFTGPADRAVERFFQTHPQLGSTERACIAHAVFAALRYLVEWTYLAWEPIDINKSLWVEPVDAHAWSTFFAQAPASLLRRLTLQSLAHTLGHESVCAALDATQASWLAENALHASERLRAAFAEPEFLNFPTWLAEILHAQCAPSERAECAQALLANAPVDLRTNTLHASRSEVLEALASQGIEALPTPYAPLGIRVRGNPSLTKLSAGPVGAAFQEGWFEVQDEGSQLLTHLVAPKRGQTVIDFCAGAGGKTLALGALMRSTGHLYALDVDPKRLAKLEARQVRSGLSNVHMMRIESEHDRKLMRFIGPSGGKADRVLVDAPCSGLGTLRRQPDLKWRYTPASVTEFATRQRSILSSAARLVKIGGRLIYATCSFLEQENEAVIADFLAEHPQFRLLSARSILTAQHIHLPAAPAAPEGALYAEGHRHFSETDVLKLWPHRDGTDAFFAAVMERIAVPVSSI
jgi:16S rRNA (cytosine967-C5)-methyltransferase